MTRRALIISNPGEIGADNYCEGVKVDVLNYKKFFMSPLGGAWRESEIIHLERPTSTNVKEAILSMSSIDYTFIAFSGHGYMRSIYDTTFLELRRGDTLDSLELRSNASKRTIVLDCCRQVIKEEMFKAFAAFNEEELRTIPLDRNSCRAYFDKQMEYCSKGIVICHACAINETAKEGQTRGGYYASSLIDAATEWYKNSNIDLSRSYGHFNIVRAHNNAALEVIKLTGGTQNPKIEKPRSEPYFPFAIMA